MRIETSRKLILALMLAALAACAGGPSPGGLPGGDPDESERPTPNRPVFDN